MADTVKWRLEVGIGRKTRGELERAAASHQVRANQPTNQTSYEPYHDSPRGRLAKQSSSEPNITRAARASQQLDSVLEPRPTISGFSLLTTIRIADRDLRFPPRRAPHQHLLPGEEEHQLVSSTGSQEARRRFASSPTRLGR